MIWEYLIIGAILAVTLNRTSRLARAAGTLVAAVALMFIVLSIVLADLDGTFASIPAEPGSLDATRPLLLNIQAVIASVAVLFLLWATWVQARRKLTGPLPWRNTKAAFGAASRAAHWLTATFVLCLVPIGMFVTVLAKGTPEREAFTAVHQTLGLVVFAVITLRLAWLLASPPPPAAEGLKAWEHALARVVHVGLYAAILAFPVSGFMLSLSRGEPVDLFGFALAMGAEPGEPAAWAVAHDWIVPALFVVLLTAHLGAVLKHHMLDRRVSDVRRMLR